MAEGVIVPFTADLSEVRSALDRLVSEAKNRPIGVPVTIGAGAAGSLPSGASGVPTIAGVFGGSNAGVAGAFGALTGLAAPGFAAPFARGGFYSAGTGALPGGFAGPAQVAGLLGYGGGGGSSLPTIAGSIVPTPSGITPTQVVASRYGGGGLPTVAAGYSGGAGGGGGDETGGGVFGFGGWGRGRQFSATFGGRGFGRIVGAGFLLNDAFRFAEADREYNINQRLAGSDQREQLNATLTYRQALTSNWVGRAVGYFQDPTGDAEAGIRATIATSEAIDARTGGIRETGAFRDSQRDRVATATATTPYEKRMRAAEQAYNAELRQIKALEDADAERTRKAVEGAAKERVPASERAIALIRSGAFRGQGLGDALPTALAQVERQDAEADAATTRQAAQARERTFAPLRSNAQRILGFEQSEARRDESFRRGSAIRNYGYEARSDFLEVLGDTRGAQGARRSAANADAFSEAGQRRVGFGEFAALYGARAAGEFANIVGTARDDFFRIDDTNRGRRVTEDLIRRNPLQARLDSIERDRQQAIQGKTGEEFNAIDAAYSARSVLARQQYGDETSLREQALTGRGKVLDAILQDDRFGDLRARGLEIKNEAFLESERLRREDPKTNAGAINTILSNAEKSEQVLMRDFVRQFKPTEFSPNRTAYDSPGNDEVTATLKSIQTILTDIRTEITNVGKAQ